MIQCTTLVRCLKAYAYPVRISAAYPFSRHNYKPCCIVFIVLYAALKHLKPVYISRDMASYASLCDISVILYLLCRKSCILEPYRYKIEGDDIKCG